MENRIFIYPADLVQLTGKHYNTCLKMYHTLLDCLGKDRKKKLTIKEYCDLEGINQDEVKQHLQIK